MMAAMDFAEGIIIGSENVSPALIEYAKSTGKPVLPYHADDFVEAYNIFYDKILSEPVFSPE